MCLIHIAKIVSFILQLSDATTPIDDIEKVLVTSTCYPGFGFASCRAAPITDDTVIQQDLPEYVLLSKSPGPYCLECCSGVPSMVDVWNLTCPDDSSVPYGTYYKKQFRFAVRKTLTDMDVIWCPLRRSACTYQSNGQVISCDIRRDKTYIVGYQLTLNIVQHVKDFTYWRGVASCSAVTFESLRRLPSMGHFKEIIILNHFPEPEKLGPIHMGLLSLIGFISFYLLLCIFRKKRCEVCQNKVILCRRMCVMCVFVGASLPDPVLMEALDEKTQFIQGEIPDTIPGQSLFYRAANISVDDIKRFAKGVFERLKEMKQSRVHVDADDDSVEMMSSQGEEIIDVGPSIPSSPVNDVTTDMKSFETADDKKREGVGLVEEEKKEEGVEGVVEGEAEENREKREREEEGEKKKKKKAKPKKPRELDYSRHVIYSAVAHPNPPNPTTGFHGLRYVNLDEDIYS